MTTNMSISTRERTARIVRTNRIRNHLRKFGYYLERSRCKLSWAPEYGRYRITGMEGELIYGTIDTTHPNGYTLTLDQANEYLEDLKKAAA